MRENSFYIWSKLKMEVMRYLAAALCMVVVTLALDYAGIDRLWIGILSTNTYWLVLIKPESILPSSKNRSKQ